MSTTSSISSGKTLTSFSELNLLPPIQKALENMSYETPTDVQAKAIPLILEGRDVLVTAQTGTGKTAAFGIPMLQKIIEQLEANPKADVRRALIVAPTRELAEQIGLVFRDLTQFFRRTRYCVVIGGTPYGKQLRELKMDPAFVIGTPGRLIDHIESRNLKMDRFDFLVLDEADRMLDMGFAPQMEAIIRAMPTVRQSMMFSATMPTEVKALVTSYLKNPARVAIGEENRAVERIEQEVIELREGEKDDRLISEIDKVAGTIIVFTKTKVKADRIARMLSQAGHEADALHGDLTQGARKKVTTAFRDEKIRILVATDIAARGLDINHIRHVINYDVPMVEEDYIHRIGRTARAGKDGHSIAFVTPTEKVRWARILRMMGKKVPYVSKNSAASGTGGAGRADGGETRGSFGKKPSSPTFDRSARFGKTSDAPAEAGEFSQRPPRGSRGGSRFTGRVDLRDGVRDPKLKIDGSVKGAFGDKLAKSRIARGEDPSGAPRPVKGDLRGGNRPVAKPAGRGARTERPERSFDRSTERAAPRGARPAFGSDTRAPRGEDTRPVRGADTRPSRGADARPARGAFVKGANRPARNGERPLSARKPGGAAPAGFNSAEARSIREEFAARVAASESGRGYDPKKAATFGERTTPGSARPPRGTFAPRGAGKAGGRDSSAATRGDGGGSRPPTRGGPRKPASRY